MARRRGQDNLGDILILANRKVHAQTKNVIEKQRQVILFMHGKKGKVTRAKLEEKLEIEFSGLENNHKRRREFWRKRKQFYRVMTPLLENFVISDRENLTYELSDIKFMQWFDGLRRTGKEMFG